MNMKMFLAAILLFHYAFSTTHNRQSKYERRLRGQPGLFDQGHTLTFSNRFSILGEINEEDEEPEVEEEENLQPISTKFDGIEFYDFPEANLLESEDDENLVWHDALDENQFNNRLIKKEIYDLIDERMDAWTQQGIEIEELKEKIQEQKEEREIMIQKKRKNMYEQKKIEKEIGFIEKKLKKKEEKKNRLMSEGMKLKDMIKTNTAFTENDERLLWAYTMQYKKLEEDIIDTVSEQIESRNYTYIHDPEQLEADLNEYVRQADKNNGNAEDDKSDVDSTNACSTEDLEDAESEYEVNLDLKYDEEVNLGNDDEENLREELYTNIVLNLN